ncbi:2'-5' RNA ligase family protein [Methanoplanus endosymbiosus]|uniref:2'-5' RNA ligase family protein n=1 Tax=Methanoplanus endosymbiosus TaxID=33865 RepID=A0A9E7PN29_9EURY|nr:2'-5' RNA ligase family protein [Methanoplanus endosymbiosus]UUX92327.1 2'-5' RNA ligase family protein [Methanoplanus endosymbiosus]
MTENIAIDIVLLPPDEISERIIHYNQRLTENSGDRSIQLNPDDCLPHISLLMGGISYDDIEPLKEAISVFSGRFLPYSASFSGFAVIETDSGTAVSGADITRDSNILNLQNEIAASAGKYLKGVSRDMVYNNRSEEITEFTTGYSGSYLNNSTKDNFSPHITIGHGDISRLKDLPEMPEEFICRRIAICHLGNHCTCRKILAEIIS